jgi:hypothetical protein
MEGMMTWKTGSVDDPYGVLPHRDILGNFHEDFTEPGTVLTYEHRPCGMTLTARDVKEANWCPHCATIINKAARRRGQRAIAETYER